MTKFQHFSLVASLAAAVIVLYFCMDLKPQVNYILQHSEYPMSSIRKDRNIYVTNHNTNNVSDTFPHVKSSTDTNYITTASYNSERTVQAVNEYVLATKMG